MGSWTGILLGLLSFLFISSFRSPKERAHVSRLQSKKLDLGELRLLRKDVVGQ